MNGACQKGDEAIVEPLLAHRANPGLISAAGTLPIHDAALSGNADVIRELVKHGANPNTHGKGE